MFKKVYGAISRIIFVGFLKENGQVSGILQVIDTRLSKTNFSKKF